MDTPVGLAFKNSVVLLGFAVSCQVLVGMELRLKVVVGELAFLVAQLNLQLVLLDIWAGLELVFNLI